MSRNEVNANRVLTGGTNSNINYNQLTIEHQKTGTPPTFQKAVVEEVIYNPKSLTLDDRQRIRDLVVNPVMVDSLAANSVIATLVSDGISNAVPTKVILFPFFQSHIMLPIQAGEQVTVVFEDLQKFGFTNGKWITRTSEGLPVEDPNFTHGDRRYNTIYTGTIRTSEAAEGPPSTLSYAPDFQNGGDQPSSYTLPQNGPTNAYEVIYRKTISGSFGHSYETVPRWTKRPQEFVIQGMNNSLIMIGQDRIGYVTGSGANSTEQKDFSGTIDIVAGRGRFPLYQDDSSIPAGMSAHNKTSPFPVENTRGNEEVDKYPSLNGRREHLEEGDPDFIHDAARIYLSMKTLGDTNFRLEKTPQGSANSAMQIGGINYSTASLYPVQPTSSSIKVGSSYVVNKADHLRYVARRSEPSEDEFDPIINGSLLLIKEGKNRTPERNDAQASPSDHLSYFYMSPEGRVQIDGMQIFLGGAALRVDNQMPVPDVPLLLSTGSADMSEIIPAVENLFAGSEPYIKWSEFKKVVEGLHQQLNDLQNAFSGLVQDINSAKASSYCPPFGVDPAWAPLAANARSRNSQLESTVTVHRTETNNAVFRCRSAKIFGQ